MSDYIDKPYKTDTSAIELAYFPLRPWEKIVLHSSNHRLALGVFVVTGVAIGIAIGLLIQTGEWYANLCKPAFNPANWILGAAWTLLYILIAIAGWSTWKTESLSGACMKIWCGQMILNWLWTPIFFGLHTMAFGLVIISCLMGTILCSLARSRDNLARTVGIPLSNPARSLDDENRCARFTGYD